MRYSERINIPASETLAINALAQEKRRRGEQVFNLSVGEPDIPVDPVVIEAVSRAMHEGKTKYPPVLGIPELREAAVLWMNRQYRTNYSANEIIVTNGGKFGLYLLLQALVEPGDEVVIIAPYWVSYPSMIHVAGGKTITVRTSEKNYWKVSVADLEKTVTEKTKILIINNAANPTGVLYTRDELEQIIALAKQKNFFIISDEVYSGLVYDENEFISLGSFPEERERIAVVQSASKNFSMTGLRVGFVFAEKIVIDALGKLQGQSTSGAASICQWAALAAVQEADRIGANIRTTMQKRRDIFVDTWNQEFSTNLAKPLSALYAFIRLDTIGVQTQPSTDFCLHVLKRANVAVVPGAPFGAEGYIRCSFGGKEEEIISAIRGLAQLASAQGWGS